MGNLTELKVLNLLNNKITKIPEELGDLTKIEFMNFIGNEITCFPTKIKQMELYYNHNYNNQGKGIYR